MDEDCYSSGAQSINELKDIFQVSTICHTKLGHGNIKLVRTPIRETQPK